MAFGRMGDLGRGFGRLGALGGGQVSPPWTPASLGSALVAWWDMSDPATITQASGTISALADKSGNGWTLGNPTQATQYDYSATGFNGAPGAGGDGNTKFMQTAAGLIVPQPFTVATLFKTAASAQNVFGALWDGSQTGAGSRAIYFVRRQDVSDQPCLYAATTLVSVKDAALAASTFYLSIATFDGANSAHYFNGALLPTPALGQANSGAAGIIGGYRWSTFNGLIARNVIINRALTADERSKLAGWMAS